jgi:hypothetical protein
MITFPALVSPIQAKGKAMNTAPDIIRNAQEDPEAQEFILEQIEATLLMRAAKEERAQALLTRTRTSVVPLRAVSEMIFQGKKFGEIIEFLDTQRPDRRSGLRRFPWFAALTGVSR